MLQFVGLVRAVISETVIPSGPLRSGWTTGACATAAALAACSALLGRGFPDPVRIVLPQGQTPCFSLVQTSQGDGWARAGVVKDAGDDPDITHGATILATVRFGLSDGGIRFFAGPGVGMISKPGLPLPVGEPAINPVPRRMICDALADLAARCGVCADFDVEISIPGGDRLALRTWNPRLGIVGGLSVLGTTGVVVPYSCAAWIHSIQRGIDVARATGLHHVVGCVGNTSQQAALAHYGLSADAIIDMGDFAGGMLKYLRHHPIDRVGIAGGFAKMCKLAMGHMDLHSKRSQVDMGWLARVADDLGAAPAMLGRIAGANTALEALDLAQADGLDLAAVVADAAAQVARDVLKGAPIRLDILVIDRVGRVIGQS